MLKNLLESLVEMEWKCENTGKSLSKIIVPGGQVFYALGDPDDRALYVTVNDIVEVDVFVETRSFKIWTKEK